MTNLFSMAMDGRACGATAVFGGQRDVGPRKCGCGWSMPRLENLAGDRHDSGPRRQRSVLLRALWPVLGIGRVRHDDMTAARDGTHPGCSQLGGQLQIGPLARRRQEGPPSVSLPVLTGPLIRLVLNSVATALANCAGRISASSALPVCTTSRRRRASRLVGQPK